MNDFSNQLFKTGLNLASATGTAPYVLYNILGGEEGIKNNLEGIYNLYNSWSNSGKITDIRDFVSKLGGSLQNMKNPSSQSLNELLESSAGKNMIQRAGSMKDYFSAQDIYDFMENEIGYKAPENLNYFSKPEQDLAQQNQTNDILSKILG